MLQGKSVHLVADTAICCSPVTYPDAKALRPHAPMNTSASYPSALYRSWAISTIVICLLAGSETFTHLRSNDCIHGMVFLEKPLKSRQILGKEVLSVQSFLCCAVWMTAWAARYAPSNPAGWSEYRSPTTAGLQLQPCTHSTVKFYCKETMGQVLSSCKSSKPPLLQFNSLVDGLRWFTQART